MLGDAPVAMVKDLKVGYECRCCWGDKRSFLVLELREILRRHKLEATGGASQFRFHQI